MPELVKYAISEKYFEVSLGRLSEKDKLNALRVLPGVNKSFRKLLKDDNWAIFAGETL
jgi:hypothetical protein